MLRGTITYKGWESCKPSVLRKYVKTDLQDIIRAWHKDYLPGHFEDNAFNKYRYKQRAKYYQDKKQRRFGHRKPLVFTGDLQRQVQRSIKVSGTYKTARGVLSAPKYMYKYRLDSDQPDKAKEITATTAKEALEFARLLDAQLQQQFDNDTSEETKRV